MTEPAIDIGDVVATTGVPVSTLHVWEQHGLVSPSGRSGLRRQYSPDVVERIGAIILLQRGGFSLAEIATLLTPTGWSEGKGGIEAKLSELQGRRDRLTEAIAGLEHALACAEPSPLECARFRAMIADVLPVDRRATQLAQHPVPILHANDPSHRSHQDLPGDQQAGG